MKRQHGSYTIIALAAATALCLGAGTTTAADIAWDMLSSSSSNLTDFSTDAPAFGSPGDGFQKYQVGVSPSIPYTLVDDTNAGYPPDYVGVIDAATDFDEFFGVVDTENNENTGPVTATWIFDISAATEALELRIDMGAMGDFETSDSYVWTYQVDGSSPITAFSSTTGDGVTITYTMADGTPRDFKDALYVNGVMLTNVMQTLSTVIPMGNTLTLNLTVTADGGSEAYVARNIMITENANAQIAGTPVPTLSWGGIATLVLLLMAVGIIAIRRTH